MPSRYYTFSEAINDTTFSRFIFLDTHPLVAHNSEHHSDLPQHYAKQQLKWLDSVLLHANEKWKIVVAHHPIYSSSPRHGDSQKLIELLKPQLEKYGVQLYISGHDHDLQHQKPDGKIDYIVSGAGSQIRKSASNSNTKFSKGISGFAALSIQHDSLHINFINYKGAIEYYYSRGE